MDPIVTAMCNHDRKVRSLAKNVFGSMRMGVVRAMGRAAARRAVPGVLRRELKYQSRSPPFFDCCRPNPAQSNPLFNK